MDIKINDYYEPEHFKALNEADYDVSHSCDYEKNAMHHIHESTEILIVESGSADYYIDGRKYYVEAGDILIIGSRKSHMRRMDRLPFARYGLAVNQKTESGGRHAEGMAGTFPGGVCAAF